MTLSGEDLAEKVINTIYWDKSDYTVLKSIRLFDKNDNMIPTNLTDQVYPLRNGQLITLVDLIEVQQRVDKFFFEIYDLNTKQSFKSSGKVQHIQSTAVCVKAVQNRIKAITKEKQDRDFVNWEKHQHDPRRYTYEDALTVSKSLSEKLDNNIIVLSILNQVYDRKNTAMVAHKKFVVKSPLEDSAQEPLLTKIPLNLTKLLSTKMEIFVKTAVGATIPLEVQSYDTIWAVKEKI